MPGTFTLQYLFFNQLPWLFVVGRRHVVKNGVDILMKEAYFCVTDTGINAFFLKSSMKLDILYIVI